jgi:hypothetical protein
MITISKPDSRVTVPSLKTKVHKQKKSSKDTTPASSSTPPVTGVGEEGEGKVRRAPGDNGMRSRHLRVDIFPGPVVDGRRTNLTGTNEEAQALFDICVGAYRSKCMWAVFGFERGAGEDDAEVAELGSTIEYWHYHALLKFKEGIRDSARLKIYDALGAWNGSKCHRVVGADSKIGDMLGYIVKNHEVQTGAKVFEYGEDHGFDLVAYRALYYAGLSDKTHGESSDVLGKKLDLQQRKRLCRDMMNKTLIAAGIRMSSVRPGVYVNRYYREVSREAVIATIRGASLHRIFDIEMIQKTFAFMEAPANVAYRSEFSLYNPSRQYIEFADCIVDLHARERIGKNDTLVRHDDVGNLVELHPVAYIDADFDTCGVSLPMVYVKHIARLMSGKSFMEFFGRYFDPIVPKACALLLTGPSNVGKSTAIAPFVELFRNVTCFINGDDTRFTWRNAFGYEHVFCEDVNPLDSHVFDSTTTFKAITGGEPFSCPVKHGAPILLSPFLQLYSTNDNLASPDALPLWIAGSRERLFMYAIPLNTPPYSGEDESAAVRAELSQELGQIVFYMLFRPDELVTAIDVAREEFQSAACESTD